MAKRTIKSPLLSAVVPIFNEGELILSFVEQLHAALKQLTKKVEIVLVDDGSSDDAVATLQPVLKQYDLKVLKFSRNFGKELAITAGLQHATGDAVLIIDSDFQHPFSSIATFWQYWRDGYDNVYGVRENRDDQTWLNRFFSRKFYKMNRWLMSIDMPENAGDFRLLDRQVVNAINQLPEANRFMKGLYTWVGFKGKGVPYKVEQRQAGKSRWNFFKLFDLAMTGITSFSDWPLRIWAWIGLVISLVSVVYGVWIVFDTLVNGIDVPGWATLVAGIMFLGGIQLICIGVIAEYIGRIFHEVKRRPSYIIAEKLGFDQTTDDQ